MLPLVYTKNSSINDSISLLENLRKDLLILPISRKQQLMLSWETVLSRINEALLTHRMNISEAEIYKILRGGDSDPETRDMIFKYKSCIDYVRSNWYVCDEPITPDTIEHLSSILSGTGKRSKGGGITVQSYEDIKKIFHFLQDGQEHPVIQAGIAYVQVITTQSLTKNRGDIALFIIYIFLYKYGWDFRELLDIQEKLLQDRVEYNRIIDITRQTNNATTWLTYFISIMVEEVRKLVQTIQKPHSVAKELRAFITINPRQEQILTYLQDPQSQITNKDVQRLFHISQITASRDLSHMTMLGLLFSHGKARSSYYTLA
ncbi:MAG: Fic family protein [Candidatus Roizmanbacteria bacterium]